MISPPPNTVLPTVNRRGGIVVLLVDDQPFTGSVVRLLLESETDIELHCCLSALAAVEMANEVLPTLILQDLIMPDIDGLALVRAFRTNPQTAWTPVVVLSGNDDVATRERARAAGADGYVLKLPAKADLIACIRRFASQSAGGRDTLDLAVMDGFHNAGAPDFTRRIIDQFLLEADSRVRALKDAAGHQDTSALHSVAHSLRGSAMMMGAVRLGGLCGRVEDKAAQTPAGEIPPALITEIDHELARVQDALAVQRGRTGPA
jgi:CheY-like chemotaxis protein/HPt (histidine-containing phosphotransfer) domain-containing protein